MAFRIIARHRHQEGDIAAIEIRRSSFNVSGGHSMSYRTLFVKVQYATKFHSRKSAENWLNKILDPSAETPRLEAYKLEIESVED